MITVSVLLAYAHAVDVYLTGLIASNSFTQNLLVTQSSKYITEFIFVVSICLVLYETTYWSGIYLGLWEYHAKDIFTEIPVHCAHVYVRLNIVKKENEASMLEYYQLKQKSKFNLLNWSQVSAIKQKAFERDEFVRYHFEFSPEDFEENPEPEYGSSIDHLRKKVLSMFNTSQLYDEYKSEFLSKGNVVVFNKKSEKIGRDRDKEYLVKCGIETGDAIDCIILTDH